MGTGGAIWPVSIVDDLAFFTKIPLRFRMIGDLWASDRALERGWQLSKVAAEVQFVLRERDQGHRIRDLKADFYECLRRRSAPRGDRPGILPGRAKCDPSPSSG